MAQEKGLKGVVKFFDTSKGFGFIAQENEASEYFFHYTGLKDSKIIDKDQAVSFDVVASKWKPGTFQAINISIL